MMRFSKSPYLVGFTTGHKLGSGKWYRGIRWALDRDFAGWKLDRAWRRVTLGRIVIDY